MKIGIDLEVAKDGNGCGTLKLYRISKKMKEQWVVVSVDEQQTGELIKWVGIFQKLK